MKAVNAPIKDLKDLQLPDLWKREIEKIIYNNRMLYEPRIESSPSFQELKDRLRGRGYTELPLGAVQMLNLSGFAKAPIANVSSCEVKKTMLRKTKQ